VPLEAYWRIGEAKETSMKAICDKRMLTEAVATAFRAVPTKSPLPIQQHFLLTAEEGALRVAAADYEMQVEVRIPAQVTEQGQCTVVARIVSELVNALPDSNVQLASRPDGHVEMRSGGSEYQLFGLPPEEFPPIPEVMGDQVLTLPVKLIQELIRQTVFACSKDQSRPQLVGVNLVVQGDTIKMAATDGNRLSVRRAQLSEGIPESISCIIPSRPLNEVLRTVSGMADDQSVEIGVTANQIVFRVPDVYIVSRLIEGQYPNFERVIPQQWTRKITVQTEEFQSALRRCIALLEAESRVVLRTEGEYLTLTVESSAYGRGREQVEALKEGEDVEIAFDAKLLDQFLGTVSTDGTVLELTGPLAPGVFRPLDVAEYTYVLMPMQLI